jgi:hypothetical protein
MPGSSWFAIGALGRPNRRQTFRQQHQRSNDNPYDGFRHVKARYSKLHRGSQSLGKANNGDKRDEKKQKT